MTADEIIRIGHVVMANSQGLQPIFQLKKNIQGILVSQIPNSEAMDVANGRFSKAIYDRLIRIGKCELQKIGYTDMNMYCTTMAIGTILKELFEDDSFATSKKLSEISNLL